MFKSLTKQGTNTGALPTDKNEQARKLPPPAGSASSGSGSVAVFGSLAHLFPLSQGVVCFWQGGGDTTDLESYSTQRNERKIGRNREESVRNCNK